MSLFGPSPGMAGPCARQMESERAIATPEEAALRARFEELKARKGIK